MPGHRGGLTKWFKEGWVDISRPRKGGGYAPCGRKSARKSKRRNPICVPASKARRMTNAQIRSAVRRKRKAGWDATADCSSLFQFLCGNRW